MQALVLCYGVPFNIAGNTSGLTGEPTAVDSFLTLLFNTNPDLGPDTIDGDSNCTGASFYPYTRRRRFRALWDVEEKKVREWWIIASR